ncbi:MAG TPA: hypothetical protein VLR50_04750 [Desulfobacterales bacterium]|nr:hypothetical protein [Desulfobacterales bacterium]
MFRLKAEAYKNRNDSADNNGWEKGTTKYAEVAKGEREGYQPQTDADIFLRRPGGGKQPRLPGNKEKLSDRIYRIVQDLFFFRKALMKNM